MQRQHAVLQQREGPLEIADVQHADALAARVDQRLVGRDIPVVDDEGAVQPGAAAAEHRVAHHLRHAGADGALVGLAAEQAHVGGDAHVVEEQRGRAPAAERQGAFRVDDLVDVVDEAAGSG